MGALLQRFPLPGWLLQQVEAGNHQTYDAGAAARYFALAHPESLQWTNFGLHHLLIWNSGVVNLARASGAVVDMPRLFSRSIRLLAPHRDLEDLCHPGDLH